MTVEEIKALKANVHATFDTPHGQETMAFIEAVGGWTPTIADSNETNDIIARDANRQLIGTLKTIMQCNAEQLATLFNPN